MSSGDLKVSRQLLGMPAASSMSEATSSGPSPVRPV
jgi:hypothetical protein